jgi:hypothetical protein
MFGPDWTFITLNLLYLLAMTVPPILLGIVWWRWFRCRVTQPPKWRSIFFFSGICSATVNFVLWWAWVVWLRLHHNPESWKVHDWVSDVGLYLLFYAILAAIVGKGRHRLLLAISSVLALLPWIPVGVL